MILTETQALLFLKKRLPGGKVEVWMRSSWNEGEVWYAQAFHSAESYGIESATTSKGAVKKLARAVAARDRAKERKKVGTKTIDLT